MSDNDTRTEDTRPIAVPSRKAAARMHLPPGIFPPVIGDIAAAFGFEVTERDPIKAARTRRAAKKSRENYAKHQKKINRKR